MKKNDQLLVFLHIQKTAGTSLRSFLSKQFDENQIWFGRSYQVKNLSNNKNVSCIGGHFQYGIHEELNRPYTYATMLREPVDRVLSYYYFIKEKSSSGKSKNANKMDIEDFMEEYDTKLCNYQTRRIAGGKLDLELAKKHLLEEFSFVGLTERFKESLYLMKREYHFPNLEYNTRNITKKRSSKDELPEKTINFIKQKNELDIELYQFAKELFKKKLRALSIKEKEELKAFLNG